MRRPLKVLVVDDEPAGRKRVVKLLDDEPDVDIVGTAENGEEAVEAIREHRPDLVFLDVQMPRKTGLEVVEEIGLDAMPATIFVTAYDEHALAAFDLAAVDYLVKPYDDERFEQAFRRARRRLDLEGKDRMLEQLIEVLREGGLDASSPREGSDADSTYLERIAVQMPGRIHVVQATDIAYITASGPYAELHTAGETFLIRDSMQSLDENLDPDRFMRIHRSVIVRLDLIESLVRGSAGDYEAQLAGGVRLPVGRSRRDAVRERLGYRRP